MVTATPPRSPQPTWMLADLDESMTALRNAVVATAPEDPDHAACLSNLGAGLRARFERTGQLADLDESITAGHAAVAATPLEHPDRSMYLATLWSIYDAATPEIADTVYATLTATGTAEANQAAHALHRAVTVLRAHHPTDPLLWAPYLHTGP